MYSYMIHSPYIARREAGMSHTFADAMFTDMSVYMGGLNALFTTMYPDMPLVRVICIETTSD